MSNLDRDPGPATAPTAEKSARIDSAVMLRVMNTSLFQTLWGMDTFVVVEKWESMDALKAHAAAPHMAAYGAKVKDFIAARTVHVLSSAE